MTSIASTVLPSHSWLQQTITTITSTVLPSQLTPTNHHNYYIHHLALPQLTPTNHHNHYIHHPALTQLTPTNHHNHYINHPTLTQLMLQYCALRNQIFLCGQFHNSDTTSPAIYMSAVISECWIIKMFSPQYSIKFSQHNICVVRRKVIKNLLQYLIKTSVFSLSFYPQLTHIPSHNYITPMASHLYIYYILSLRSSTHLTSDIILWCTRNPVLNWFPFPFHKQGTHDPPFVQWLSWPIKPPVFPINLIWSLLDPYPLF